MDLGWHGGKRRRKYITRGSQAEVVRDFVGCMEILGLTDQRHDEHLQPCRAGLVSEAVARVEGLLFEGHFEARVMMS